MIDVTRPRAIALTAKAAYVMPGKDTSPGNSANPQTFSGPSMRVRGSPTRAIPGVVDGSVMCAAISAPHPARMRQRATPADAPRRDGRRALGLPGTARRTIHLAVGVARVGRGQLDVD